MISVEADGPAATPASATATSSSDSTPQPSTSSTTCTSCRPRTHRRYGHAQHPSRCRAHRSPHHDRRPHLRVAARSSPGPTSKAAAPPRRSLLLSIVASQTVCLISGSFVVGAIFFIIAPIFVVATGTIMRGRGVVLPMLDDDRHFRRRIPTLASQEPARQAVICRIVRSGQRRGRRRSDLRGALQYALSSEPPGPRPGHSLLPPLQFGHALFRRYRARDTARRPALANRLGRRGVNASSRTSTAPATVRPMADLPQELIARRNGRPTAA